MKKIVALILGLVFCLTAASGLAETPWTPGTYTGSAEGMYSTVTVAVTLDETSMTDVSVVEQNDTLQIAAAAATEMPANMVAAQSVNVDSVSGATMTSYAIRTAVKDALTQAGALEAFDTKIEKQPKAAAPDESVDLVIVGGGGSGLNAAIYAKKNGVDSVLLLEKLAYTGGSTALSGGGFIVNGTEYNAPENDHTPEQYVEFMKHYAESRENRPEGMEINEALAYKISAVSGPTFLDMLEAGMPYSEGYLEFPYVWHTTLDGKGGFASFGIMEPAPRTAGERFSVWMTQYARDEGAEIRTHSKVTELIVEDGAVTGVKVEGPDSVYNVYAKKVILACGGLEGNSKLVAEYAPEAYGAGLMACSGNTGDFIPLTEGLDTVLTGYGSVMQAGANERYEANSKYGGVSLTGLNIWVNQSGERFCDETKMYYEKSRDANAQEGHFAWGITDSTNPAVDTLEEALSMGLGFTYKADTLQELAEQIGVPADALVASVEGYNQDIAGGMEFQHLAGGSSVAGIPIQQAPYYAQKVRPLLMFTLTSLVVDDNCRVMNASGEAVANLYAVGEVAIGNIYFDNYACCSTAVQIALMTGRIAAEDAAAAMAKE